MMAGAATDIVDQRAVAFRAARRHTVFVKALRLLLPIAGLAGLAFYGVVLKGQFSIGSGTFKPGTVQITADDLKMKNPTYFGVTKDEGKYNVRAREAAVGITMTGPIKLEGIDGDLVQANGATTKLSATRGVLEREKSEIQLFDGVNLDTTTGMKARLKSAHIYAKDHRIVSKEPLQADMPTGTLFANTMDLKTDRRQGVFGGNVALRLTPSQDPQAARAGFGLGADSKRPVEIWSQTFAIDDQARTAAFTGGVIAQQGETQLRSPELHMTYENKSDDAAPGKASKSKTISAQPGAQSQLTKLQARSGVTVTAGADRRVIAETADFDVPAEAATFTGNVEVTQGKNVLRGGRLWLDRKSGKSRLDSPAQSSRTPGRIFATFVQAQDGKPAPAKAKPDDSGSENTFGAFKTDPNAPVDVDADTLDINDGAKTATFRGKVGARQGEMTINTSELVAFYTGQAGLISSAATDGADTKAGAQMSKIETRGGTTVRSKDGQEATADIAHFDIKANTVVMSGKDGVTLKRGPNLSRGARLKIDLKTGEARLENDNTQPQAPATQPTAAQMSITAKAGVAPPPQPDGLACNLKTGQQCAVIFPQQLKDQRAKEEQARSGKVPVPRKTQDWQPSTSPSPVYRAN